MSANLRGRPLNCQMVEGRRGHPTLVMSLVMVLGLAACTVPLAETEHISPRGQEDATPDSKLEIAEPKAELPSLPRSGSGPVQALAEGIGHKPLAALPSAAPSTMAPPPIEEIIVSPRSLTGYWRLSSSRKVEVDAGVFSGIHLRYGGEIGDLNICWARQVGDSFTAECILSAGPRAVVKGSIDDDAISMRWWVGPATFVYSGKFADSSHIVGGLSFGALGVAVTGDVPATLSRLTLPDLPILEDKTRQSADLIRQVWEDVRKGQLQDGRYTQPALKNIDRGMPKELAGETPTGFTFLGKIFTRLGKEQPEILQDVYQVDTDAGRRLCRVGADGQGRVLDFNCRGLNG